MGFLLGLATALSWGTSDFLARFAARRAGTLRATFYMQATGFVLLSFALYFLKAWGHLFDGSGWQPWAWGVVAGGMNVLCTLAFYQAFAVGKLSVVAPISASYPALTTMLAVASGERLTGSRLGGIVLTIAGVVSVAMGEEGGGNSKAEGVAEREAGRGSDTGISWALLAAGGFGVLFWVLGVRVVPHTGPYATVWMIRLTSTIVTGAALLGQGKRIVAPTGPLGWQVLGMGVLDTGAFLMNNRGLQIEQVSVVTVLSSLYSAVTIALAAAMLREHLRRVQWVGVAVIFAGIYLISR